MMRHERYNRCIKALFSYTFLFYRNESYKNEATKRFRIKKKVVSVFLV